MIDPEALAARLVIIEDNDQELRAYQLLSFAEFCATTHNYWAVQHGLLLSAQAVADIARHIVSSETGQSLESRIAIEELGTLGVLPQRFAKSFSEVVRFRNLVVHEYIKVDLAEVYSVLQNDLDDFIVFAGYVNRWLESNYPSEPP